MIPPEFLDRPNPGPRITPLSRCGNSSVGRARPCQGRGREFESRFPLQISPVATQGPDSFRALSFPAISHGAGTHAGGPGAIHKRSGSAIICGSDAGIAQLVEHDLAKVGVASSSLVSRSRICTEPRIAGVLFSGEYAIISVSR